MAVKKKKYKSYDALRLAFEASPVCMMLYVILPVAQSIMQTGKKNYQAEQDAEKLNRRTEYLGEVLTGRENVDERTLFGYNDEVSRVWQEQYEAGRNLQGKVTAGNFMISKGSSMLLALISLLVALTLIADRTIYGI